MLIAGLFGHRRPPDPLYEQWLHAVSQWFGAHWGTVAVIVPVAGALAAGIVNHYLAVARENRTRRLARADQRARVHADLAARLLSHCTQVRAAVAFSQFDPSVWRSSNAGLRLRAQAPDVIEVLERRYVSFMAAIERERRIVEALPAAGERRARAAAEGACEVLRLYVPFIADFGEPAQAGRLEKHAGRLSASVRASR
jgi:hypothetical protein